METAREKFGFGKLQLFYPLALWMIKNDFTLLDLVKYVENRKKAIVDREERLSLRKLREPVRVEKAGKPCPCCKTIMINRKVNTNRANQTGDDSTDVYTCNNCKEQIYYNESRETLKRRRYM